MQRYPLLLIIFFGLSITSSAQLNYLFSSSTRQYVPVTNGITPHLQSDYVNWEVEDEGFARVPIGFTFKYDGEDYSFANIDVNGFITLKDSLNIFYNYPYFTNRLKSAPAYNKRPVIAAFWDDLLLPDTFSLVYKTTGRAPFRIFTVEWKKAKWVYESLAPVLSIELKLYETTNIIEFHYKDEGNLPDPRYSYASIGITSDYANRGFISLQSTSPHPEISFLKANDSLHVKPADNQVYRFTPSPIKIPPPLDPSLSYTNSKVSFQLGSHDFNIYEYAILRSPIPPTTGKRTFAGSVTISSLTPATTYYIYARTTFFGIFNSQWTCDSFTTAVNPVRLPYLVNIDETNPPTYLSTDMRQQDFQDTSYYYFADNGFFALPDFPEGGDIGLGYFHTDFYDANNWLFTPGFEFVHGKTYQLKFGYYSYYEYNEDDVASMEVKYGRATGAAAMTQGTLFKKTDIHFPEFAGDDVIKTDTTIVITPQVTGTYYIGFHNMSRMFQAALIISNISVTEKAYTHEDKYVLTGKVENRDNILSWGSDEKHVETDFVVERSKDGIGFEKIGTISASRSTNTVTSKKHNFKISRNTEAVKTASIGDKHSKLFEEAKPELWLHDGSNKIDLGKVIAPATKNNKGNNNPNISLKYSDARPEIGTIYYRLKQVRNGKALYSNIIKLERTLQVDAVFPNPVRDIITIKIKSITAAKERISITGILGKELFSKEIQLSPGMNNVQLSVGKLPANTYFMKIIDKDNQPLAVEKLIKL